MNRWSIQKTFWVSLAAGMAGWVVIGATNAAEAVAPPAGAITFCLHNPSFCAPRAPAATPLAAMSMLESVNRSVNAQILPGPLFTDAQKRAENLNWRVVMPGGLGDCIEYSATKEMVLAWSGIPAGAMRLAEVRTQSGALHMVLLVNVGRTVVVLDNLDRAIWPADLTHYEFIAVQDRETGFGWIKPDGAPR